MRANIFFRFGSVLAPTPSGLTTTDNIISMKLMLLQYQCNCTGDKIVQYELTYPVSNCKLHFYMNSEWRYLLSSVWSAFKFSFSIDAGASPSFFGTVEPVSFQEMQDPDLYLKLLRAWITRYLWLSGVWLGRLLCLRLDSRISSASFKFPGTYTHATQNLDHLTTDWNRMFLVL